MAGQGKDEEERFTPLGLGLNRPWKNAGDPFRRGVQASLSLGALWGFVLPQRRSGALVSCAFPSNGFWPLHGSEEEQEALEEVEAVGPAVRGTVRL